MEQQWVIGADLGFGISEFGKVGAFEIIGAPICIGNFKGRNFESGMIGDVGKDMVRKADQSFIVGFAGGRWLSISTCAMTVESAVPPHPLRGSSSLEGNGIKLVNWLINIQFHTPLLSVSQRIRFLIY